MTQRPRAQGSHPPEREGKGEGMSLARIIGGVVTSALLAAAVLGTALGASDARAGATGQARFMESSSEAMAAAQRRRAREALRLQRLRMEQAAAHARMPDTMYASTPDGAPPPHAVPLDVKRPGAPAPLASPVPAPPPATSPRAPHPAVRLGLGRLGVARRSAHHQPLRCGRRGTHRGVRRCGGAPRSGAAASGGGRGGAPERGGARAGAMRRRGSSGASGAGRGTGVWRLRAGSTSGCWATSAPGMAFSPRCTMWCPRARRGTGWCCSTRGATWCRRAGCASSIRGWRRRRSASRASDDAGVSSPGAVRVTVPAQGARTLTARALESGGAGLIGALGTGTGRWRLHVTADRPVVVMSLIASAGGHLVNVSTAPAAVGGGESGAGTVHRVAWLPAAARWRQGGVRGLLRLVNHTRSSGEVRIEAFDDAGVQAPAVTVAVGAHEAVELTSAELEGGNAAKGLTGGIGAGEGTGGCASRRVLRWRCSPTCRRTMGW